MIWSIIWTPYPSKYSKKIHNPSEKNLLASLVGCLNLHMTSGIIEILQFRKEIEFYHFIKDSRMSEFSEFFSIEKLVC